MMIVEGRICGSDSFVDARLLVNMVKDDMFECQTDIFCNIVTVQYVQSTCILDQEFKS